MCCHREISTLRMKMTSGAVIITECNPQAVRTREGPIALDDHNVLMGHVQNTRMSEPCVKCVGLPRALCTHGITTV